MANTVKHRSYGRMIALRVAFGVAVAIALVGGLLAVGAAAPTAAASDGCRIELGFATLRDLVGATTVGDCVENARYAVSGDGFQRTSGGLLVWRKADNWTGFTDGYRTWANGPLGLQVRLNTERFSWESDYCAAGTVAAPLAADRDVLFQESTLGALLEGVYDGEIAVGELRRHGDFGIGTFDALDGEMVVLGCAIYQVKSDGVASVVADATTTPFAAVTFFDADRTVSLEAPLTWNQLTQRLDGLLPTVNIAYAVKVEGTFKYVKARSVPRQSKPYPKLLDVVSQQPTFEFRDVQGTMVGLRLPSYMDGVNVAGYHWHFLTADRKAGGHVLEVETQSVVVAIDDTASFRMDLPSGGDFYRIELGKAAQADVAKVER